MKAPARITLLAAILFLFAGCASDSSTGTSGAVSKVDPIKDYQGRPLAGRWEAVFTPAQLTAIKDPKSSRTPINILEIKLTNTFKLTMRNGKQSEMSSGTASVKGDQLFLALELVNGLTPQGDAAKEPFKIKINADGSLLTADGYRFVKK